MASQPFKVIIAGGGPVGIVAAHSLYAAGIDFVVLERRDVVSCDEGASLVLAPPSLRIMHQLGLLESLQACGAEFKHAKTFTKDGHAFSQHSSFQYLKQNHGSAPLIFRRAQLVQKLYDGLPEAAKAKYLLNKKVTTVQHNDETVTVDCADGTSYTGSVLIGADGVHSKIRHEMRRFALESDPNGEWDDEQPYSSEYRVLWGTVPKISEPGEGWATQAQDHSVMYLAGLEHAFIFLYEKLPAQTKERNFYTQADTDAFAARFADYHVDETHTVKELYDNRITGGMSDLEEGIVKQWSWGRIALVGDACHKFTPNAGLGFNNGIQDVAALCNVLCAAVNSSPSHTLTTSTLHTLFATYQAERAIISGDLWKSASLTRQSAWKNIGYYILGRYIMCTPFIMNLLTNWVAPIENRKSLVLDYVHVDEPFTGKVEWLHPLKKVISGGA